ncbi:MAG: hypothetical protein ABSB00_03320 [Minisyncoccia bacterium]|jgi:type IV secretory pathway VirB2 component (pilin)
MKKILLISVFCLFLLAGCAPHVFAASATQNFVPLAGIPGLTQNVPETSAGLAGFFNNLYKYLIGIAAILAIIVIIYEGIRIATNQDNVSTLMSSKNRIWQAIFGLVLVLSPVLVFSIINPSILNLSLDLPKINLTSTTTSTGTGTQTPTVDTSSGCTVTGTSGILQFATCPSLAAAKTWGQSCGATLTTDPLTMVSGTVNSYIVSCQWTKKTYVFINTAGTFNINSTINRLQPVASTASNSNNGSDAIQFANICKSINLGWKTCINGVNWISDTVTCSNTTPAPITAVCKQKTLVCGDNSFWLNNTCSGNPSWTIFQ